MAWSEAEVERILALLRANGETVTVGGSRCHTTYGQAHGEWYADAFDEGMIERHPFSEAGLREVIAREPESFEAILRGPAWRAFGLALLAGDFAAARGHLEASVAYGDPYKRSVPLRVAMSWPTDLNAADHLACLEHVRGHTAWHCLMDALGWQRTVETGRVGVWFMDTLGEVVGPVRNLYVQRSAFRELAGDLAGAAADLELECQQREPDDPDRPQLAARAAALRAKG